MAHTIVNIVFDLGNVLIPVDRMRAYERLEPFLPKDKAELMRKDVTAFEKRIFEFGIALECGTISFDEFQNDVKRTLGITSNRMDLKSIYCDIHLSNN